MHPRRNLAPTNCSKIIIRSVVGELELSSVVSPSEILAGGSRVISIAEGYVDLRGQAPDNLMWLLVMADGSLASGGRGGGFGERRVSRVLLFRHKEGSWSRLVDVTDEQKAAEYEVPYHVSRLPMTLADGSESMGYGVVEPELVREMMSKAGLSSSA